MKAYIEILQPYIVAMRTCNETLQTYIALLQIYIETLQTYIEALQREHQGNVGFITALRVHIDIMRANIEAKRPLETPAH